MDAEQKLVEAEKRIRELEDSASKKAETKIKSLEDKVEEFRLESKYWEELATSRRSHIQRAARRSYRAV